jgi:hypothetical protein
MKTAIPSGDEAAIRNLAGRIEFTTSELQVYARQVASPAYHAIAEICSEMQRVASPLTLAERSLREFGEFAALIADHVRTATSPDGAAKAATGAVPFYVA